MALIRRQILVSGARRARDRDARRLPRGARAVAARQAARARRAQGRRRRLHRPDPRRLRRRARPARGRLRRHAGASSPSWTGRASSSSPPRRTSCARRSSRSAASSSCSPTRSSTTRPAASSSSRCSGQVERMRNLATELLDLSRLESGALELRPEPTDVGQLAREVAAEFTPAAARHNADVELDLAGEPIELDCDPERVAQVLRILLDNALVHTPEGTGVRVSAARANGHVRLEVSDRGLGIKRQNMPHIFEPFFTSNDEAQGAGLGLAIARELAERMHGELTVRSVPGPHDLLPGAALMTARGSRSLRLALALGAARSPAAASAATTTRRRLLGRTNQDDDHARRGRRGPGHGDGKRFDSAGDLQERGPGRRDRHLPVRLRRARVDHGGGGRRRRRLRLRAQRRGRDRHQRARRHPGRGQGRREGARGLRRVRRRQPRRGRRSSARTRTPTSRCSRSTRRA